MITVPLREHGEHTHHPGLPGAGVSPGRQPRAPECFLGEALSRASARCAWRREEQGMVLGGRG